MMLQPWYAFVSQMSQQICRFFGGIKSACEYKPNRKCCRRNDDEYESDTNDDD